MGKKVNPNLFRLVVNRQWKSQWIASNSKEEVKWIEEEDRLRKLINIELRETRISHINIVRWAEKLITVRIHCVEVGILSGQDNKKQKELEAKVKKMTKYPIVKIEVVKVQNPELNAQVVAYDIATAIENREPYKKVQKRAISRAMGSGAKGIKTKVSGRLNGSDMSRSEGYLEGLVPTQTLKQNVEYATRAAVTPFGLIGVKVWVCYDSNKIVKRGRRRDLRREGQ